MRKKPSCMYSVNAHLDKLPETLYTVPGVTTIAEQYVLLFFFFITYYVTEKKLKITITR